VEILILKMKHGDYFVSAGTNDEEARAYLHLFRLMDKHGYYAGDLDSDQLAWRTAARKGDATAAKWLLNVRSDWGYEYEEIERVTAVKP